MVENLGEPPQIRNRRKELNETKEWRERMTLSPLPYQWVYRPDKDDWEKVFKDQKIVKETSDGSTASYYELPKGATELYHLIIHKNMNAQIGEIFRAAYRYGASSHSDQLRDAKKIKAYAEQEIERLTNGDT